MVDSTKILLINDNERIRHDVETVLAFLGEDVVSVTSVDWHGKAVARSEEHTS